MTHFEIQVLQQGPAVIAAREVVALDSVPSFVVGQTPTQGRGGARLWRLP